MYELVFRNSDGKWSNDGYGEAVTSESMSDIAEAANSLLALDDYSETEFAVRDIESQQIIHFD